MLGTPSSTETACAVIKEVVRLNGVPSSITDRGVQFTSMFWRDLCKMFTLGTCFSSLIGISPPDKGPDQMHKPDLGTVPSVFPILCAHMGAK